MKEKMNFRKRVPTISQMEATECGAACLGMVLAYHGKWVSLEELRAECGVSRDGSSAYYIINAAKNYGLDTKAYSCEIEDLECLELPAIIHWGFDHFVILEGIKKGKAYINDPAIGPRIINEKELSAKFTGVVLCFKSGEDFIPSGAKENVLKSLKKRFKGLSSSFYYLLTIGLSLVITGVAIPTITQIFIDNLLIEKKTDWLIPIILFMIGLVIIRGALIWLREKYLQRMEVKLILSMYSKYFWHILRLPIEFFSRRYTGDIIFRMNSNEVLAKILGGDLLKAVLDLFMAVFYLFFMLKYSVILSFVGVAIVFINLIFVKFISKKIEIMNFNILEDSGKLHGVSSEGIAAIETIKANGEEQEFFSKWSGHFTRLINTKRKMDTSFNILQVVPGFFESFSVLIVLIVGSNLVIDNKMTIGMLIAFMSLMNYFTEPVMRLSNLVSDIAAVKGHISRLDDVLNYEVDILNKENPKKINQRNTYFKLDGRVTLQGVSFGYNKLEPPIIEELSIDIKPGSKVAIVGASGNGKSTIARIIAGLEKPLSGDVLFDNISSKDIDKMVLSSSLVLVEQNISVFEGTIRENLTLWDSTISDEDIIKATKDTLIYEDIMSRPNGFESIIEENGRNFSGGQIQRIELARALVTKPSILILDEATSALDPYTEKEINEKINKRGCTCIIVAHRLSTIKECDEIIVLDNGIIAQRGKHEDLKNIEGIYNSLISLEFYR